MSELPAPALCLSVEVSCVVRVNAALRFIQPFLPDLACISDKIMQQFLYSSMPTCTDLRSDVSRVPHPRAYVHSSACAQVYI